MCELPNFDQLVALNKSNPKAFEALRENIVDSFIDSVPSERKYRLQGLQFHIDSRRDLAHNPLDACICISRMMHETFWDMHGSLENFSQVTQGPKAYSLVPKSPNTLSTKTSADILPINYGH